MNWLLIDNNHRFKLTSFEFLTIDHCIEYLNYMKTEFINRGRGKGQNRKPDTLSRESHYLSKFYSWLAKLDYLSIKDREFTLSTSSKNIFI